MEFRRSSIFDYIKEMQALNEDEGDDTTADAGGGDTGTDQGADSSGEDNTGDDAGGDEDFNIDTDLNDEDTGGEGEDDLDMGENDDMGGDDDSSSSTDSSSSDEDEEPIEANTDIFSSLTAEEQQMKIQELKNLFSQMYASSDDTMSRINDIDNDIVDLEVLSRLTGSMYRFRQELQDYIVNVFANKSYIENQIEYIKFISVLRTMTQVVDDLHKQRLKDLKK